MSNIDDDKFLVYRNNQELEWFNIIKEFKKNLESNLEED